MSVSLVNISHDTLYPNSVYVDSSLFCHARNRLASKYQSARIILGNLVAQNVMIYISNLVMDEIWWALLNIYYRSTNPGKRLTHKKFKRNPLILNPYKSLIRRNTDKTLRLPNVHILPTHQYSLNVMYAAKNIFMSENIMPRDCFHLAFTVTSNIHGFVTSDSDFDNLNLNQYNLIVFKY